MCEYFVKADPIQYEQRTRTIRIHGVLTSQSAPRHRLPNTTPARTHRPQTSNSASNPPSKASGSGARSHPAILASSNMSAITAPPYGLD